MVTTMLPVVAGIFAGLFTLSGATKIRRPYAAATAIHHFGVLSSIRSLYGRILGAVEITLALSLVIAPMSTASFAAIACTLATFTYLIAHALRSGSSFACACFGDSQEKLSQRTLVRSVGLLVVAITATVAAHINLQVPTWPTQVEGLTAGVLLLCVVAIALALVQAHPFSTRLSLNG